MASISVTMVSSCWSVINALPSVFLMACFVRSTTRSQKPPYHGACLGINLQVTLCCANSLCNVSDSNNLCRSSATARNVDALSEMIKDHRDFWLENLWKANKKVCTVRSWTTSMCTARVTAHVKIQIYTFLSSSLSLMYRALVKSTPVTVNGGDSVTRTFGSGGGSGAWKGFFFNLLQITHHFNNFLMH